VGFIGVMPVWSADDVPLPKGARMLDEPIEAALGEQPIRVNGFATWLTAEELRAFYKKVLPPQGWHIETAPWIARTEQALEKLDDYKRTHGEAIAHDPTGQSQLARVEAERARLRAVKQQLVYAVRQNERLLLILQESGATQPTRVAVNRWTISSQSGASGRGESSATAEPEDFLSKGSPCCTGEAVPQSYRKLPGSIPSYPNARVVLSGGSPVNDTSQTTITEFAMTEDPVNQVADYYQRQMAYNGWSLQELPQGKLQEMQESMGPQGRVLMTNTKVLAFKNNQARCTVAVTEQPANMTPATKELPVPITTASGSAHVNPKERTAIIVTYFESKAVTDYLRRIAPGGVVYGQ